MPFLVVFNPPRHGKSLLLDRLFLNDPRVLVIPITYNSNTPLNPDIELTTKSVTLHYFWLRVLKRLSGTSLNLHDLNSVVDGEITSFSHVVSILSSIQNHMS